MKRRLIQIICALGLLAPAAPTLAEEVMLGLGYDRSRDGHGFELHKADDLYVLYFYTYTESGEPEWLLGLAEMDNGVLAGDLQRYTYQEGAPTPAVPDPDFEGEFRLDFTKGFASQACNDGVTRNDAEQISEFYWRVGDKSASWCTEFLSIGLDYPDSPYYGGIWYAGLSDSGYGFTMSHMGDTVTALVYYYDSDGQPRWALGSAPDTAPGVEVRSFQGYCRTCTPVPVVSARNGTVVLDWSPNRSPGTGDDVAEIDLQYPQPPGGDFLRTFTLNRLSDGEPIGEYEVQFRIADSVKYAVVWETDALNSSRTDVFSTTQFGVPFSENRVNVDSGGTQNTPAVGVADDGSYVVAWEDDRDGNGSYQIYARGFFADGSEKIATFTVNGEGRGQQRYPDVAVAPNGDFVVVWEDDADGNRFGQILGRGFNANGSEKFADLTINSAGAGQQEDPAIAIADNGSFVVVWADDQDSNGFYEIAMRGFNANGSERFSQRNANTDRIRQQNQPDVAMAANGNFVVVWTDDADGNQFTQILGRGFSASGSPLFNDITINSEGAASQYHPAVAMAPNGSFAATWVDQGHGIAARAFVSNGQASFDDVLVNSDRLPLHNRPDIGIADDGTLIVVWSYLRDDGLLRLQGRPLSPAGQTGAEFIVSTSAGLQYAPVIAVR